MNNLDKQYLDLLQDILDNGYTKGDRTGTGTISVFGRQIRHKMSEGYSLLTTKKMAFKTMVTELLWFLRGDTNIKYLVDNGCNIWNGDAYKNYVIKVNMQPGVPIGDFLTQEEFIDKIKTDDEFAEEWGELGPIYGKQWRSWSHYSPTLAKRESYTPYTPGPTESIDQIENLLETLKTNPDSRRMIVSTWNVAEIDDMVLPPCHYTFQVYTRELSLEERNNIYTSNYLGLPMKNHQELDKVIPGKTASNGGIVIPKREISLIWNQRSVDTPLGLPFNIASYGLLLEILAKEVNMVPGELIGNLGDTHIYQNQIEGVKEQLQRKSYPLCKLDIHPGMLDYELDKLHPDMFTLVDYKSEPTIKFPLSN